MQENLENVTGFLFLYQILQNLLWNHGTGLAVVLLYICQIIWKMFILSRLIAADMCLLLPFCGGGNGVDQSIKPALYI